MYSFTLSLSFIFFHKKKLCKYFVVTKYKFMFALHFDDIIFFIRCSLVELYFFLLFCSLILYYFSLMSKVAWFSGSQIHAYVLHYWLHHDHHRCIAITIILGDASGGIINKVFFFMPFLCLPSNALCFYEHIIFYHIFGLCCCCPSLILTYVKMLY